MTKKELGEKVIAAQVAGTIAFKNGQKCIPALDKNFDEISQGLPISTDSLKVTEAWIKGWTLANFSVQAEMKELEEIGTKTDTLIGQRNEARRTVKALINTTSTSEIFWFLLPGRIKLARKRLDEIQEQIDFNLAYTEMKLDEMALQLV